MISFISLNSVVKKIQKKGFGWLYARIKREFVSPTFEFTRYLSRQIESLRKLYQRNNDAPQNKIVPEDTLLLIYDLNVVPATFDFAFFWLQLKHSPRAMESQRFLYFSCRIIRSNQIMKRI